MDQEHRQKIIKNLIMIEEIYQFCGIYVEPANNPNKQLLMHIVIVPKRSTVNSFSKELIEIQERDNLKNPEVALKISEPSIIGYILKHQLKQYLMVVEKFKNTTIKEHGIYSPTSEFLSITMDVLKSTSACISLLCTEIPLSYY